MQVINSVATGTGRRTKTSTVPRAVSARRLRTLDAAITRAVEAGDTAKAKHIQGIRSLTPGQAV